MKTLSSTYKPFKGLFKIPRWRLVRVGEDGQTKRYQPLKRTLAEARKAGMSVGDYIDARFQLPGATQATVERLATLGVLHRKVEAVCEIGPGSGRYLEKVERLCQPKAHDIYETDSAWRQWLTRTYRVRACHADGVTLRETATGSMDLIHAHKVFVYLPCVVVCSYFSEMIRAARPGGHIVFDCFTEACMSDAGLEKWISRRVYYPCMLPRAFVINFFEKRQSVLCASFLAPMLPGESEYFVFQKQEG